MRFSVIKEAAVIIVLAAVSAILYNSLADDGLAILYSPVHIQPGSAINISELNKILSRQTALLIDARTEEEFKKGHIPGAQNLPLKSSRNFKAEFLIKFPKKTLFILYCINSECTQAERLAKQFNLSGFSNTLIFSGGWEAWQEAGPDAK